MIPLPAKMYLAFQVLGIACGSLAALLELKALLGRGPAGLDGAALHLTRAGFLLLSGALVAESVWIRDPLGEFWPPQPSQLWNLLCWLVAFTVLHVHRVKAFKGRPEAVAGVAGWALAAGAWFVMR